MSDKLNFLFIITDMQKRDHLSCYNSDMVLKTPNIDKIAEEGTKFTNFYCNNPICMPNRSTIYTGQYPSVHGVTTNGRNLPKDIKTFTDVLLESGLYHTASFGKIHLNYFGVEHKLIETAENLISREFLLPKDFPNLTHELPFYGLEEVELITGHGWMC
ncbi:MAG: sulfatase-like hydrolase/transferase, partial [archaeon]|nr:sulfatase-like hydrolase/transferase [archaeon]